MDIMARRSFMGGIAAGVAALVFAPAQAILPSAEACMKALTPVVATPACVYPAGTISFLYRSAVHHPALFDRMLPDSSLRAQHEARGGMDHYAVTWDGQRLVGYLNGHRCPVREVPPYRLTRNGVPLIPEWWPPTTGVVGLEV